LSVASEQPTQLRRPAALDRAAGIELLGPVDGSGYEKGAALVRRADGQMVQLGPLMYALLECVDGRRSLDGLAEALGERVGRACDVDTVRALAEKLAAQGLLAGSEQNAPPRRNPLLALRWKVLVTNPRATRLITAPFTVLFSPVLVVPVAVALVAVFWFVLIDKGISVAAADAFHKPGLLLLIFALGIASAGFHELGHAAACRYGGAVPGGMGAGIYMVWPAFYTDVTDAYRLPRRDRLRVDLGGIYFNALIAVVTTGAYLVWHVDALLLLVALQFLMIVKNLSPVIRSDGYHVLADATGVPDLYAHILPTVRRLIPGRGEPSALRGRARLLVTAWVLIVVPVLVSLMVGALLLMPRLATSAWVSGRVIVSDLPHESAAGVAESLVRLVALTLPLLGSVLLAQRLARGIALKAHDWSKGRPARRSAVLLAATATAAAAALAWYPAGQYQPVQTADAGTLVSFTHLISSPTTVVHHPSRSAPVVKLPPGKHLAIAMIPRGGPTKAHPALFVIPAQDGAAPVAIAVGGDGTTSEGELTNGTTVVHANAFPFKLPAAPKPGDSQALAVNHSDGSVVYDIAYSLVRIENGAAVTNANSALAFANCNACTTVAVSFQLVLVIGQSNRVAPINAAGSLNVDCPACVTVAVADQIVITLTTEPSDALLQRLQAALQKLDALPGFGPNAITDVVSQVQTEIKTALDESGLVDHPAPPPTPTTTQAATTTAPSTTTEPTTTAAATTTSEPTTTSSSETPTTTQVTTTDEAPSTTTEPTTTQQTTTITSSG
jgi:putative peptide zinc metalloprotease protein